MATTERRVDRGTRRGNRLVQELGRELREARIAAGLSQQALAHAAGLSHPTVSRIERGRSRAVSIVQLARLFGIVGLDLSARAYPSGDPLRDAAHERLLGHFLSYVAPPLSWRREVPLPGQGDPRAWDALISGHGELTAVEAETRLTDAQALQRRLQVKLRDAGVTRLILVLSDTRSNRAALREAGSSLASIFPVSGRALLGQIAAGRHPSTSGYVVLGKGQSPPS
jgi:transcriptional regulator with XRE-family HTH domain